MKRPSISALGRGKTFRRYSGLPLEARLALPGRGMFAMTWRVQCRRLAAETRGGQDTLRVSYPPLDTPTSSLGRDSLRSRV